LDDLFRPYVEEGLEKGYLRGNGDNLELNLARRVVAEIFANHISIGTEVGEDHPVSTNSTLLA